MDSFSNALFFFEMLVIIFLVYIPVAVNLAMMFTEGLFLKLFISLVVTAGLVYLVSLWVDRPLMLGVILLAMSLLGLYAAFTCGSPELEKIENTSKKKRGLLFSIFGVIVFLIVEILYLLFTPITIVFDLILGQRNYLSKALGYVASDDNRPFVWALAGMVYSIPAFFTKNIIEYLNLSRWIIFVVIVGSIVLSLIARSGCFKIDSTD